MMKVKSIVIILLALIILIGINSSTFAADLNKVTYDNSKITVSGTCTSGDQVQIAIFDLNKQPMYFATVKVENGVFNSVLPASFDFEDGETYTVKIADYNGTGATTKTFVATENSEKSEEKDETPKTGTTIGIFSSVIVFSTIDIITSVIIK